MILRILIFLCLSISTLCGQELISYYNFDCNLEDVQDNYSDIQSNNDVNCDCGILGDAIELNGSEAMTLDTSLSAVLDSDFGVSFYFKETSSNKAIELLSLGNNCSSDSTFRIYYLSELDIVRVEVSESVVETIYLEGNLKNNKCWHHVLLTREQNNYELYLDGTFVDSEFPTFEAKLNFNEPIKIGFGECSGLLTENFEGYIDELKFYNQHIQSFLVEDLYIPYNEILTQDTTIFLDDTTNIEATINCSGNINWSPNIGLSATDQFLISVTGIETTQYTATFNEDGCTAIDTITINVINKDNIDCGEAILPNVFTPNGDGLNDKIGILNGFIMEDFGYFQIFDRWGELVFETENKEEEWDGYLNGKAVNPNTFLYKINYTCGGEEHTSTGSFLILR